MGRLVWALFFGGEVFLVGNLLVGGLLAGSFFLGGELLGDVCFWWCVFLVRAWVVRVLGWCVLL